MIDESDLNQCEGDSKVYQIMLCFHVALNVAADDQPPTIAARYEVPFNDTVSRAMPISMSCDSEVCVPRDLRSGSPDEMRSDKVCNALFIFSF